MQFIPTDAIGYLTIGFCGGASAGVQTQFLDYYRGRKTNEPMNSFNLSNQSRGSQNDAGGPTEDIRRQIHGPAQPGYAGDLYPELAWAWHQSGQGVVVDIRSDAERAWVGFVPNIPGFDWKHWPSGEVSAQFDDKLRAAVPTGQKVLFLCRSGVRSIAAAKHATTLGYEAFNILEGFEGDPDEHGHRGNRGGWRFRGLPWRQN